MSANKDYNRGSSENRMHEKVEEIDNKLDKIRSDIHNLNRIASIRDASLIIDDLKKLIGGSEKKAAVLYFTKDEIKAGDLADKLGVPLKHLSPSVKPFLGNKWYITVTSRGDGREKYYQRSELVDNIGFENVDEFKVLIESFLAKHGSGMKDK